MTQPEQKMRSAENLIRKVLSENFGQRLDNETLRAVAEKVSRSVPSIRKAETRQKAEAA